MPESVFHPFSLLVVFHLYFTFSSFYFMLFGITYFRRVIVILVAHFYEDNLYIHALGLNPSIWSWLPLVWCILVHCYSLDSSHFCSTTCACIHLLITFIFPISICRPWKNIGLSSPLSIQVSSLRNWRESSKNIINTLIGIGKGRRKAMTHKNQWLTPNCGSLLPCL